MMKLPSGLYIPDTVDRPWELLPRIAGGAGVWTLALPELVVFGNPTGGGITNNKLYKSKEINLLEDQPTMMQQWELTDIRIPLAAYVETLFAAKEKSMRCVITATAIIRVGGDIRWQKTIELPLQGPAEKKEGVETIYFTGNSTFTENFVTPILVPHGRTLTMELQWVPFFGSESGEVPGSGVSAAILNAYVTETNKSILSQGIITYTTRDLSGHRSL